MRSLLKISWLFAGLLMVSGAAYAQPQSITVKQLLAKETLTEQPLVFNRDNETSEYQIKAYVQSIYFCPPCPHDAMCKPCSPFVVLADAPNVCPIYDEHLSACQQTFRLILDSPNNYQNLTPGTQMLIKVQKKLNFNLQSYVTPEERAELAKNQQLLKKTLDSEPGLEPAKRPDWLKNVPGESYQPRSQKKQ